MVFHFLVYLKIHFYNVRLGPHQRRQLTMADGRFNQFTVVSKNDLYIMLSIFQLLLISQEDWVFSLM
jgi:hypothetical protein